MIAICMCMVAAHHQRPDILFKGQLRFALKLALFSASPHYHLTPHLSSPVKLAQRCAASQLCRVLSLVTGPQLGEAHRRSCGIPLSLTLTCTTSHSLLLRSLSTCARDQWTHHKPSPLIACLRSRSDLALNMCRAAETRELLLMLLFLLLLLLITNP